MSLRKALANSLFLFVTSSVVATLAYGIAQQGERRAADIVVEQSMGTLVATIQQTDDYATVLQYGIDGGTNTVEQSDISGVQFLALSSSGEVLAASARVGEILEVPPAGLLDGQSHKVTWQTESGKRYAATVRPVTVDSQAISIVGYISLTPYEVTTTALTRMWLAAEAMLLAIALVWGGVSSRKR